MFIWKPDLMKLVHHQGYNPDILPIVCEGVPSIHYCLEFIPDIQKTQSHEKYEFSVKLASYLSKFYPIQKSLDICFNILKTYHLSTNIPYDLWIGTMADLSRMVESFPILLENFLAVFTKFGKCLLFIYIIVSYYVLETGDFIETKELVNMDGDNVTIKDVLQKLFSKITNLSYTPSYV